MKFNGSLVETKLQLESTDFWHFIAYGREFVLPWVFAEIRTVLTTKPFGEGS